MSWLVVLVIAGGCSGSAPPAQAPVARVGARWGLVAGSVSIGVLGKPTGADAVTPSEAPQCVSSADLTKYFGPTCGSHEASAAGSASVDDDFGHPAPTATEERWYCACPMVARVVIERCPGGSDTFKVLQVALVTKDGCDDHTR